MILVVATEPPPPPVNVSVVLNSSPPSDSKDNEYTFSSPSPIVFKRKAAPYLPAKPLNSAATALFCTGLVEFSSIVSSTSTTGISRLTLPLSSGISSVVTAPRDTVIFLTAPLPPYSSQAEGSKNVAMSVPTKR